MNNLSPLYYVIIAASAHLLGYHEWGLRLPSILAGTLLVPSLFWVVRRFTGSWRAALAAAAFAAFDPFLVAMSLEVRPYALLQLAAIWQVHQFSRLFERKRGAAWRGAR